MSVVSSSATLYLIPKMSTLFMFTGIYLPLFFLQLYAVKHNVSSTLAFYSVRTLPSPFADNLLTPRQLTILNAVSAIGRIVTNLAVNKYGPINAVLICSTCCTLLLFCLLAVKNAVGIVLFAAIYGFFIGSCAYNRFQFLLDSDFCTVVSLIGPMLVSLAKRDSEIGERLGIFYALTGT